MLKCSIIDNKIEANEEDLSNMMPMSHPAHHITSGQSNPTMFNQMFETSPGLNRGSIPCPNRTPYNETILENSEE